MRLQPNVALVLSATIIAGGFLAGGALAARHRSGGEAADNTLGVALLSAAVLGDGTLFQGAGALSVVANGSGNYRVKFVRDLVGCTAVASSRTNTGLVQAADLSVSDDEIQVWTTDFSGVPGDRSFSLLVFCTN